MGNPFRLRKDGDRAAVIARYRDDYLPFQRDLLDGVGELCGKALGCWSAPTRDLPAAAVSGPAARPIQGE